MTATRRAGVALLALVTVAALGAGWLAPNPPGHVFSNLSYAPPTRIHVVDAAGEWRGPFVYRWRVISQLERRFEEDRSEPVPLRWFAAGHLASPPNADAPLLLLGTDGFGRDIFSRLLHGARASLALALAAAAGAIFIGLIVGGTAGYAGGWLDDLLSRVSELVLVLPVTYVVLSLRAVLPLELPDREVFLLMAAIFALVGWPFVARGVRAIVATERQREYALAAHALGAGHGRMLVHHLLPAAAGFLGAQATLLVPAFILSEATLSFVGLGFSSATPSWGTMLRDASNVAMLGDAPWALAPAAAIFVVVLAVNLVFERQSSEAVSTILP